MQNAGAAVVQHINNAPSPDAVASPQLEHSEGRAVLRFPAAVSSGGGEVQINFKGVLALSIGWPNDEILHAHRLWDCGLKHYSIQEVFQSDWIAELDRRNALHPRHIPGGYRNRRHIVITFQDATFECIALAMDLTHARNGRN
jgi:hypothetical protein